MHYPTDTIAHTTAFVAPFVEHWLERELTVGQFSQTNSVSTGTSPSIPNEKHINVSDGTK